MTENIVAKSLNSRIKHQRFIRIAERRVNKMLDNLENLGKCSNRQNYEYTEGEVRKIFREIDNKVKETKILFQGYNRKKKRFVLER